MVLLATSESSTTVGSTLSRGGRGALLCMEHATMNYQPTPSRIVCVPLICAGYAYVGFWIAVMVQAAAAAH
jgi:hypothetical protein